MVKKEENLFQLFGIIHNHIYANEGFSPQEAFNEFLKVLLIKLEVEKKRNLFEESFNLSKKEYLLILEGKSLDFKKKMENIFKEVKKDYAQIFKSSENLNLKSSTLAFVVRKLQEINFCEISDDIKGMAFQKFIFSEQRGSRGQFLTPDPIIDLAVNFVNPTIDDTLIDPACGTGGFLIKSIRHLNKMNTGGVKKFLGNVRGIEITPSVIKLAKVRMILEGAENSGIINADSLLDFDDLEKINKGNLKGAFSLVLTNPPFGTQGKINDKTYLKRFSLGNVWDKKELTPSGKIQNSQTPEVLFVERSLQFLKDGGKMAIVLPNGILENKTLSYVREFIMNETKILGIVSLPSKTFIPHGTGVKTSILFVQKLDEGILKSEKESDYPIFFSIIENVGYAGNKNGTAIYKEDINGKNVLNEDISEVIRLFHEFEKKGLKKESDLGFVRRYSEIKNRLDAEFYKPEFKKLEQELIKRGAVPLGELVQIKSKSNVLKDENKKIKYVEITNISSKTNEITNVQKMKVKDAPSRASYKINENDILTAVAGVSTGTENHATALVTKDFNGAICTNGFRVIVPAKIDRYYLLHYLKSDLFLSQMKRYRTGAAIPAVTESDLKKILIMLPDGEVIREISEKVREAFELKEKARNKLKDLKNYPLL